MSGPMDGDWWYCLKHGRVEHGAGCPDNVRMGPYPDEPSAANALRHAAERNEAWDAEEEREE
ncbi:hypothetical protein CLV63_12235 [Murinocardiopsis flavida]|uniref:SPOR domain-containing protein n=1 Tax=Murinocardiopsis flavida TaxID=645275 RepID=A0A2P8CZV5_9ACTN|nr:hypothetical protein [Murinocardiopsis flavida]PSK90501.1 hypothetical protein CLV63_12235 [Murinocardiopsis flavida]